MISASIKQTNLYGLDKFFYNLVKLHDEKKLPSKILLNGKKGIGKSTLAFHLINYIFSINEEFKYDQKKLIIDNENRSFQLVNNNTHPNFYLVDLIKDKKNIDIDQIRSLITYLNKSSFNNFERFIIIDNIEFLNQNSINALLKIIEEPNEGVFFILINNNNKKILPTLVSRCISYNINLSFQDSIKVTNNLLNKDLFKIINFDLINYYNSPGDFIDLINFSTHHKIDLSNMSIKEFLNLLINQNLFRKSSIGKKIIFDYIELYFFYLYRKSSTKFNIIETYYSFVNKIYNTNRFNLDDESLFIEFKYKILNG